MKNNDDVTCYANAALQCIFNCEPMKTQILQLPNDHVLRKALNAYLSKNGAVNVIEVRQFVSNTYKENHQQDIAEFLGDLFDIVPALSNIVEFDVQNLRSCFECKESTRKNESCKISMLPVTIAEKKTVTLQEIFDKVFSTQEKINAKCGKATCKGKAKIQRMNVKSHPLILVVQLLIYESGGNG